MANIKVVSVLNGRVPGWLVFQIRVLNTNVTRTPTPIIVFHISELIIKSLCPLGLSINTLESAGSEAKQIAANESIQTFISNA